MSPIKIHKKVNSQNLSHAGRSAHMESSNGGNFEEFHRSFYENSPVAKHYSQDLNATVSSTAFNRRLKMRDTFTKIFPSYTHGTGTVYITPHTHSKYIYPE